MKKIAIYVCGEVSRTCVASGCLKAFNQTVESFERYKDEEIELTAFNHCNGCNIDFHEDLAIKIEKMKKFDIDTIHVSTCIRGRCDHYEDMVLEFGKYFDVIGYTHGSSEGKQKNNLNSMKVNT